MNREIYDERSLHVFNRAAFFATNEHSDQLPVSAKHIPPLLRLFTGGSGFTRGSGGWREAGVRGQIYGLIWLNGSTAPAVTVSPPADVC